MVFTSDHGDHLGDFNFLLKGALMPRSINNVSLIWVDPRSKAGAVSHALTSTVDIAPTIIERAGLKPYFGIQGKSLLSNLKGLQPCVTALLSNIKMIWPGWGSESLVWCAHCSLRAIGSRFTREKHRANSTIIQWILTRRITAGMIKLMPL